MKPAAAIPGPTTPMLPSSGAASSVRRRPAQARPTWQLLGRDGDAPHLIVDREHVGDELLRSPLTNKGTGFTVHERTELGLVGLLPPRVETLGEQVDRAWSMYLRETSSLGRYRYLRRLQDTNEVLFHALLSSHVSELLPIVYTPTVGEGVEQFSEVWENARGLCVSVDNAGSIADAIAAIPNDDVRMIVATDASAILGIGDQGYNGLAIAIGKLALYTVGGVSPYQTLPVMLDVGTDRASLRDDPRYLGSRQPRLKGAAYLSFVAQFVEAVKDRWPRAVVQWEDFGKESAFEVLDAFRSIVPSFNDDIQGTGAVALAGLLAAVRAKATSSAGSLATERFLVFGAGAGGMGVARAIVAGLERERLSRAEALARVFVVDSKGLLVEGRAMESYKRELAQPRNRPELADRPGWVPSLLETIERFGITALIGLSGQPMSFGPEVLGAVARNSDRPIVFALSNPTAACEATPEQILVATEGRAIVATGSPFPDVVHDGVRHVIGQGNNAFVFPGLGIGVLLSEAKRVTDGMVAEAAEALAQLTIERYGAERRVYPPVADLDEAAIRVALGVMRRAVADGVAGRPLPDDLEAFVRRRAWRPAYVPFRLSEGSAVTVAHG